jgi:hypothetical protein
MNYQRLLLGFLSIGTVSAWMGAAQAATLSHLYGLNNTFADSFGGSSLVANGGALAGGGGYTFAANQGPSLSNAINANDYSILLDYSFSTTSGYRKIIDFKNLIPDTGLYNLSTNLNFFPVATGSTIIGDNTPVRLVLTRDGITKQTTGFFNGVQQFTFIDSGDLASFTGPNNIINFFQDDNATGRGEASGGFLRQAAIYDGALDSTAVANLGGFGANIPGVPTGTQVPEPFTIVGTLVGGTAALRMRKKLKATSKV